MPIEFEHITVPTNNLEASIAFYTTLGMELIELESLHHAHFESKEHQVVFTAYYNEQRPDDEVKVYLEVDDIELLESRFRESLQSKIINTEWQGKELRLTDPDGNFVNLYQKQTTTSIPPWQKSK